MVKVERFKVLNFVGPHSEALARQLRSYNNSHPEGNLEARNAARKSAKRLKNALLRKE